MIAPIKNTQVNQLAVSIDLDVMDQLLAKHRNEIYSIGLQLTGNEDVTNILVANVFFKVRHLCVPLKTENELLGWMHNELEKQAIAIK